MLVNYKCACGRDLVPDKAKEDNHNANESGFVRIFEPCPCKAREMVEAVKEESALHAPLYRIDGDTAFDIAIEIIKEKAGL